MTGRRFVVTGAAGFIGSHLVEALLARGDEVVGIDNFDSYYERWIKERNCEAARQNPAYRLVEGDIRDAATFDDAFAAPVDVIIHLAARAGVRPSIEDPVLYSSVNVVGTATLLDACARHGVGHVVLGSSSSVYGGSAEPPFREDEVPDRPVSPYAATKRANEMQGFVHHHLTGATVTCLRFFTVYGPRQRPEMAIHNFTRLIDTNEPVPMFGDGSTRRDYTFVSDIVAGIIAASDRPHDFSVYNLGTTATTSLADLIALIGESIGKEPIIDRLPLQPGDVPFTHADISRAQAELGYAPQVSIREGLGRFAEWYVQTRLQTQTR